MATPVLEFSSHERGYVLTQLDALLLEAAVPMDAAHEPGLVDLVRRRSTGPQVLLSKDFSVWASACAFAAEIAYERNGLQGIRDVRETCQERLGPMLLHRLTTDYHDGASSAFGTSSAYALMSIWWNALQLDAYEREARELLRLSTPQYVAQPDLASAALKRAHESGRRSEKVLERQGLVLDPDVVVVGGVAVAVLGLVPTEFSIRTKQGERVLTEIKAKLWKYRRVVDPQTALVSRSLCKSG